MFTALAMAALFAGPSLLIGVVVGIVEWWDRRKARRLAAQEPPALGRVFDFEGGATRSPLARARRRSA
jgi:uncharacterized iron-regulated membrane protein